MAKPWEKYQQPAQAQPKPWEKYSQAQTQPQRMEQQPSQPERSYLGETISNVPGSALQFGKNLVQPIIHPQQTATAMGQLGADIATQNPVGRKLADIRAQDVEEGPVIGQSSGQALEGMKQFLSERYGGTEQLANTAKTDPIGFAADLATVLTAGGGAAARLPGVAGRVGETVAATGRAINPINVAKQAVTAPLKAIPQSVPNKLYASATKMSTTLEPQERLARIKTGLQEGIMPSQAGLDKLQGLIDKTNQEIANLITKSAKRGDTIESHAVRQRLNGLRKFADDTIDPASMHEAITAVEENFKMFHGKQIPVDKAQRLKQNTYTLLRKAYGELKSSNVEAQKQIARGIKEELAAKYPQLNELNAKESALIRLENSIEKAANRIANRDVIGLGGPAKTGAGAVMAGHPGALAGLTAAVLDHPQVKAAIAIALNKAKQVGTKRARPESLAAYQAGQIKSQQEKQQ